MTDLVVLSLFPGIDLLGRGFEAEGYCVVRGPDTLWGGDIREFHPPANVFSGIIGGSPCPDFSRLRRAAPTGYGLEMLAEFARVVLAARPNWWLLENVPSVPDVAIDGYTVQRIDVRGGEVGLPQRRLRHFQFGCRDSAALIVDRQITTEEVEPAVVASGSTRRGWSQFCGLMGLPPIELKGMTKAARYRAVGNGVPVPMARLLAAAIRDRHKRQGRRVCGCSCGRPVTGRLRFALSSCRKRMQRRRDRHDLEVL